MRKYTEEELQYLESSVGVEEFNARCIELEDRLWWEGVAAIGAAILNGADTKEVLASNPMQEAFPYRFSIRLASENSKKYHANVTPESRERRLTAMRDAWTPEARDAHADRARSRMAKRTPEEKAASLKKAWAKRRASQTQEQISAAFKKGWEARRENKLKGIV